MQRLLFFIGLLAPLQAHDLITTAVTWDRDVSRIVYARCASCHQVGPYAQGGFGPQLTPPLVAQAPS
jgi:cytochrome c